MNRTVCRSKNLHFTVFLKKVSKCLIFELSDSKVNVEEWWRNGVLEDLKVKVEGKFGSRSNSIPQILSVHTLALYSAPRYEKLMKLDVCFREAWNWLDRTCRPKLQPIMTIAKIKKVCVQTEVVQRKKWLSLNQEGFQGQALSRQQRMQHILEGTNAIKDTGGLIRFDWLGLNWKREPTFFWDCGEKYED